MDPTIQRCHGPLKDALDSLVQLLATYIIPTASTLAFLCTLQSHAVPIKHVVLCGVVYYWVIHFEAVTAYFHGIVLPRAIDLSLDPPAGQYVHYVLYRVLAGTLVPAILLSPVGRAHPTSLGSWGLSCSGSRRPRGKSPAPKSMGIPMWKPDHAAIASSRCTSCSGLILRPTDWTEGAIPWGGLSLPLAELLKNFLVIGAVGSGKTLVVKAFLTAILPLICAPRNRARSSSTRSVSWPPPSTRCAPLQNPDDQSGRRPRQRVGDRQGPPS